MFKNFTIKVDSDFNAEKLKQWFYFNYHATIKYDTCAEDRQEVPIC